MYNPPHPPRIPLLANYLPSLLGRGWGRGFLSPLPTGEGSGGEASFLPSLLGRGWGVRILISNHYENIQRKLACHHQRHLHTHHNHRRCSLRNILHDRSDAVG